MSNINNAQISGRIVTPFTYVDEQTVSLTQETLSIVGTAAKGPAFVPQQVLSFAEDSDVLNTWENIFGGFEWQDDQLGPISARSWLNNNGEQLTYTRVLGIGNGKGLNDSSYYDDAGFIVGDSPLSGSTSYGIKGPNSYAVAGGNKGKTHFFGTFVENIDLTNYVSPYEDYIEQITGDSSATTVGLVTDVVLSASGTQMFLQDEDMDDLKIDRIHNEMSTTDTTQSVNFGNSITTLENPRIYQQGHNKKEQTIISWPSKSLKYRKHHVKELLFNEKPDYYLYKGHLRYASFQNLDYFNDNQKLSTVNKHFVTVGKNDWNEETNANNDLGLVNYEDFASIYQKAITPWIVSQSVRNIDDTQKSNLWLNCKKLFRFKTYSDGKKGNKYRIRISPRRLGNVYKRDMIDMWSKFDVVVYMFNYKLNSFKKVISFIDLNLNPHSDNYIGKKIGTEYEYYDITTDSVIHEGFYRKTNNHIFVEIDDDVEYEINKSNLMPCGFLPYPHLNINNNKLIDVGNSSILHNPLMYVGNRQIDSVDNEEIKYMSETYWGVSFDKTNVVKIDNVENLNEDFNIALSQVEESLESEYNFYHNYTKHFQKHRDSKFWLTSIDDTEDDIHNDFFHLEKILYMKEKTNVADRWNYAFYRRDGKIKSEIETLPSNYFYVNIEDTLKSNSEADAPASRYLSFDLFTYGGFDGINILDENKRKMNNESCLREYNGEIPGSIKGQTTYMYEKAKDIALDLDNFRCDIFSIPSITTPEIVDPVIRFAEDSGRFLYLFDTLEYDAENSIIIDSYYFDNIENASSDRLDFRENIKSDIINGTDNTITNHLLRFYNSKYAINSYSKCEAIVNNKNVLVSSDVLLIESLSQTSSLKQPIDSLVLDSSIIEYTNPVNSKLIYSNNYFDDLLVRFKDKDVNINPVGVISAGKKIKILSGNTQIKQRKNSMSLAFNIRIYLDIKRSIRNLLVVEPSLGNQTVLFSSNSETNILSNPKTLLIPALETLMQEYVDSGLIRNFYVDLRIEDAAKARQEKLDNMISGEIGVSFFGEPDNSDVLSRINLNNLISNVNDFTNSNNINIININN